MALFTVGARLRFRKLNSMARINLLRWSTCTNERMRLSCVFSICKLKLALARISQFLHSLGKLTCTIPWRSHTPFLLEQFSIGDQFMCGLTIGSEPLLSSLFDWSKSCRKMLTCWNQNTPFSFPDMHSLKLVEVQSDGTSVLLLSSYQGKFGAHVVPFSADKALIEEVNVLMSLPFAANVVREMSIIPDAPSIFFLVCGTKDNPCPNLETALNDYDSIWVEYVIHNTTVDEPLNILFLPVIVKSAVSVRPALHGTKAYLRSLAWPLAVSDSSGVQFTDIVFIRGVNTFSGALVQVQQSHFIAFFRCEWLASVSGSLLNMSQSTVRIANSTFDGQFRGGGVHVQLGTTALFENAWFVRHYGSKHAALVVSGTIEMRDCLFVSNIGTDTSVITFRPESRGFIQHSIFRNNSSPNGNVLIERSEVRFIDCFFISNKARQGGAVMALACKPSFSHCTFDSNSAWQGAAIAFMALTKHDVLIDHCYFESNLAQYTGGAMYFQSAESTLKIGHSSFINNRAVC